MSITKFVKPVDATREKVLSELAKSLGTHHRAFAEVLSDAHDMLAMAYPYLDFDLRVTTRPRDLKGDA